LIVGLRGKIMLKEPTKVHLDVQNVVYEVAVSLQTSTVLSGDEVYLHTTHVVREDAQLLYGFYDVHEKEMFDRLIKINGVGPKVGLAICSTFSPMGFLQVVQSSDVSTLKRVPGIGPKSASRILVELSGFMPEMKSEDGSPSSNMEHQHQASLALESLGFKKEAIAKALKKCTASDTSEIVKQALKQLQ
jgi:holliday junction DNA helicase RuvA